MAGSGKYVAVAFVRMAWRSVREVGLAMVTAGVVVLLFVAYELFATNLAEEHSQAQLAREFTAALSRDARARPAELRPLPMASGPVGPRGASSTGAASRRARPGGRQSQVAALPALSAPPGGAIEHLVIPAIGVNRYVVQGVGQAELQMGPGHYPGTPLPGQRGNVAIAGHRTTFGAPFFRLNDLVRGDLVYLTDLSGTTWVYSVQRQWVVPPTDVGVLGPTRADDLTLTTCNPRFLATSRLVVRAVLVGRLGPGARLSARLPARQPPGTVWRPPPAWGARVALRAGVPSGSASRGQPSGVRGLPAGSRSPLSSPVSPARLGHDQGTLGRAPAATSARRAAAAEGSLALGPSGDGGATTWAAAFGWGALAVLVWSATRLVARRWRRYAKVGVLLAGALVCLVPLWFAFGAVVDLLPANL